MSQKKPHVHGLVGVLVGRRCGLVKEFTAARRNRRTCTEGEARTGLQGAKRRGDELEVSRGGPSLEAVKFVLQDETRQQGRLGCLSLPEPSKQSPS